MTDRGGGGHEACMRAPTSRLSSSDGGSPSTPVSRLARAVLLAAVAASVLVGLGAGCEENPVGGFCWLGSDAGAVATTTISNGYECQSRMCLQVPLAAGHELPAEHRSNDPLCTGHCESDDDCERVPSSPCVNGFTCAVATAVGPFCCERLCICKDYLIIPDGGIPVPAACDPDEPDNRCVNLPGR
jgi:hypothetical protein